MVKRTGTEFSLQHPLKNQGVAVSTCKSSTREVGSRMFSEACWPDSLAESESSKISEDLMLPRHTEHKALGAGVHSGSC